MSAIRVVIVDDHPVVRHGIRILLEATPDITIVGEAGNGIDALRLVEEQVPDVLLLDIQLPDITGMEVMQRLKDTELYVVGVSAYDDPEYVHQLLEAGAAGYLTKDVALDEIVDAVRGVVQGQDGWLSQRASAAMASRLRRDPSPEELFSSRQYEVLSLAAQGCTVARIATELEISERTVRFHLTNVYTKLKVQGFAEAVAWALNHGLADEP